MKVAIQLMTRSAQEERSLYLEELFPRAISNVTANQTMRLSFRTMMEYSGSGMLLYAIF